jgi:hypothetical protein
VVKAVLDYKPVAVAAQAAAADVQAVAQAVLDKLEVLALLVKVIAVAMGFFMSTVLAAAAAVLVRLEPMQLIQINSLVMAELVLHRALLEHLFTTAAAVEAVLVTLVHRMELVEMVEAETAAVQ